MLTWQRPNSKSPRSSPYILAATGSYFWGDRQPHPRYELNPTLPRRNRAASFMSRADQGGIGGTRIIHRATNRHTQASQARANAHQSWPVSEITAAGGDPLLRSVP